jgi:hypothetical protein
VRLLRLATEKGLFDAERHSVAGDESSFLHARLTKAQEERKRVLETKRGSTS